MGRIRIFSLMVVSLIASNGAFAHQPTCTGAKNRYFCENRNWVYSYLFEIGTNKPDAVRYLLKRARCRLNPSRPLQDQIKECEEDLEDKFVCTLTILLVQEMKANDRSSFYDNCNR